MPAQQPFRRHAGAVAVLAAALLPLTACTAEEDSGGAAPGSPTAPSSSGPSSSGPASSTPASPAPAPASSGAPSPSAPAPAPPLLPESPAVGRPALLAAQLEQAWATLHDPAATAEAVRRAGELQQLAARALASRGRPAAVEAVSSRLSEAAAYALMTDVAAAADLQGLAEPQPRLPDDWRIVAPPPRGQLLRAYREAQRRTGVPWEYLAAIHLVETRMGRIRGTSTAGAQGPMQFLPSTWAAYGGGGDINDPRDAILGAARLLRANGAPGDMAGALWNYNHSDRYVRAVTGYASVMERSPAAYAGYWSWRVLYRHVDGTYVLEEGYPEVPPQLLPAG